MKLRGLKEKAARRLADAECRDMIRGYNEYNRRDNLLHRSEQDPERKHRLDTIMRALSHTPKH